MSKFAIAFTKGAGGIRGLNHAIHDIMVPALKASGYMQGGEGCSSIEDDCTDKLFFNCTTSFDRVKNLVKELLPNAQVNGPVDCPRSAWSQQQLVVQLP